MKYSCIHGFRCESISRDWICGLDIPGRTLSFGIFTCRKLLSRSPSYPFHVPSLSITIVYSSLSRPLQVPYPVWSHKGMGTDTVFGFSHHPPPINFSEAYIVPLTSPLPCLASQGLIKGRGQTLYLISATNHPPTHHQ